MKTEKAGTQIPASRKQEGQELFTESDSTGEEVPTITHERYLAPTGFLKKKSNPALLPIEQQTSEKC